MARNCGRITRRTRSPEGNVIVRCLNADVSFSRNTASTSQPWAAA